MKILVKITNNKLSFLNRKKLNTEYKNMLNTNVINNDELLFSDTYIFENPKLVSTFFNDLINSYHLTDITIQNMEVANIILPLLKLLNNVNTIIFESEEVLSYKLCELLLQTNIKYVNAYYIPNYIFELLDKNSIITESRSEILFTSNFMNINNLKTYSSLFYKTSIYLNFPMSSSDFEDLETFTKINRHLRVININNVNRFNLEQTISILTSNLHKNVKIIINSDVNDPEVIEYLRKNNKILKRKQKIIFKLRYSDKYLSENIVKETNNHILRSCGLLIIGLVMICFGYILYDNYKSLLKESEIKKQIEEYIVATDVEEVKNINDNEKTIVNDYIAVIKNINPEVVGWLKVDNLNIDYPILQTDNNEHYLDYNIYNEKDPNGWLFLDYENNPNELDDNNIFYGHNRYVNGVMFGRLNKALYKDWYTKKDNQYIYYDNLYGSYVFKIFSIYVIPTTNDYIHPTFSSKQKKIAFLNKIKKRSIYDFGVNVNSDTKIITLSTCGSDTTRIVIHGALIEK